MRKNLDFGVLGDALGRSWGALGGLLGPLGAKKVSRTAKNGFWAPPRLQNGIHFWTSWHQVLEKSAPNTVF